LEGKFREHYEEKSIFQQKDGKVLHEGRQIGKAAFHVAFAQVLYGRK
jgi:hypothetical protein